MSVCELHEGFALFQILFFKNVLKPLAYNRNSKMLQFEKRLVQNPMTQQFSVTQKRKACVAD
jgi:hypothetical protein